MEDLQRLKELAESQARDKNKIEGKIESLMEQLKSKGYGSGKEAAAAMKELGERIAKMKKTLAEKVEVFKKEYAPELEKVK
jgi:hypothetical protein